MYYYSFDNMGDQYSIISHEDAFSETDLREIWINANKNRKIKDSLDYVDYLVEEKGFHKLPLSHHAFIFIPKGEFDLEDIKYNIV